MIRLVRITEDSDNYPNTSSDDGERETSAETDEIDSKGEVLEIRTNIEVARQVGEPKFEDLELENIQSHITSSQGENSVGIEACNETLKEDIETGSPENYSDIKEITTPLNKMEPGLANPYGEISSDDEEYVPSEDSETASLDLEGAELARQVKQVQIDIAKQFEESDIEDEVYEAHKESSGINKEDYRPINEDDSRTISESKATKPDQRAEPKKAQIDLTEHEFALRRRMRERWDKLIEKYSSSENEGDIINLQTMLIEDNQGHITGLLEEETGSVWEELDNFEPDGDDLLRGILERKEDSTLLRDSVFGLKSEARKRKRNSADYDHDRSEYDEDGRLMSHKRESMADNDTNTTATIEAKREVKTKQFEDPWDAWDKEIKRMKELKQRQLNEEKTVRNEPTLMFDYSPPPIEAVTISHEVVVPPREAKPRLTNPKKTRIR